MTTPKPMPTTKKKPRTIVLQDRDLEILRCVYDHRFLTRSLILPLFGHTELGADTNLDRRLRKLVQAGYLQRLRRPDRRTEFVYALTSEGSRILKSQQLQLPGLASNWKEKNRTAKIDFIEHTLMAARWYAAFTVATREHPSVAIDHYERESRPRGQYALVRRWERRDGEKKLAAPDALLILDGDGVHPQAHFLEADRSTMTNHDRMAEKFEAYAEMYRERRQQELFDVPSFRVCVVTISQKRASNLLNLLLEGTDIAPEERKLFWFTPEETYRDHPANVLAAIWMSGDRPGELRALVESPLARRTAQK